MSLSELMKKASVPMPKSDAAPGGGGGGGKGGPPKRGKPVPNSRDLERIIALPRREPLDLKSVRAEAMVQLITERYTNGRPADSGCRCREIDKNRFKDGAIGCITNILPVQAWALYEMGLAGGCIGSIVVGGGKTILNILSIFALGVQTGLALIPSNLLEQFWSDYQLLSQHFKVPSVWVEGINKGNEVMGAPKLYVLPYGLLSRPGKSDYIDRLRPEAIICDEADKLADIRGSATARRVLRYYVHNPYTKFAGWTGSLTDKKISEYSHLVVMALKDNAPVPHDPLQVTNWGEAIDVSEQPAEAGALRALMNIEETMMEDEVKAVRRAYGRRLCDTLGVISTSENEVEVTDATGKAIKGSKVEVIVQERPAPEIPPRVQMALDYVRGFVRPDKELGFSPENEELDSPTSKARAIMEISSGVMNVWEFPPTTPDRKRFLPIEKGGVPQENSVIDEWYDIRARWNKSVRKKVMDGLPYLDSPFLCEEAAARFHEDLPQRQDRPNWDNPLWPAWRDIRKHVKPQPVAKRIDPYIVNDVAKWATENVGIVWYDVVEFGAWVAEVSDLPMRGGGKKNERALKEETGERSVIASISSHGRGRNGLQFLFDQQLLAQIPASSRRWEQLLGRLIRRGQRAVQVVTWLYLHVPELRDAVEAALKKSEYAEDTLRMRLKLRDGWKG